MSDLKPLGEIFGQDDNKEELYSTDQKKRYYRAQKGRYSKTKGLFNFLNLIKDWESVVGPMMAKNTIPLKIKSQTLFISTKHPIFAQELGFLAPEILLKVKEEYPELENKVSKIKFSYSKYTSEQFSKRKETLNKVLPENQNTGPHKFSPLYKRRLLEARQSFQHIEDEEVKSILIDFMLTQNSK